MEADLFQQIYDVLESRNTKLILPIRYGSPINKIIWSSFDYMCGPTLRFVWEAQYAEPSLVVDIDDDSSSDRISKEDSTTNEELQYDDALCMTSSYDPNESHHDQTCVSSTSWLAKTNEEDSAQGTSTLKSSSSVENTTITLNNDTKESSEGNEQDTEITDDEHSSYTNVSEPQREDADEEPLKNSAMITSVVDSGITGTISMHSDLSSCRSPKPPNSTTLLREPIDEIVSSSSDHSDYGIAEESPDRSGGGDNIHRTNSDDSEHLIESVGKHATASFLNASNNVLGLSMLGASLDYSAASVSVETESKTLQQLRVDDQKSSADEADQVLSDEEFVAKFVLAEQIFSLQFDSNPMIPKISVVPNRRLLICSYLFCARNDTKSMMALSVVLSEDVEEWFYAREAVFEEIFVDIIPRFKASLCSEQTAEMVYRMTDDFIELFNLWGTLDRFPLVASSSLWKSDLSKTHLMDDYMEKRELQFLYKAITGCLMCQGYVVVIGNDSVAVNRIMATLSLFLRPSQRLLCTRAYASHYNPYLRIQALKRGQAEDLFISACESHWPVCFVDADRRSVSTSGNYFEHRERKQALQLYQLAQIFKESESELEPSDVNRRAPIINPIPIEADAYVSNMLDALFLLAPDQAERLAFIEHFQMNLDYKAQALVQTVKELSEPAKSSKESFVSSKWSLSGARKLLNLTSDTTFSIVLARTDATFSEFVYQTAVASTKSHHR